MLFGETVAVYCENHTEHTDCGQIAEFWYVKSGGTYSNLWALKGSALCHEDIWESGGIAPPFLTSALDGG
jgi:hypothetical protein